LGYGLVGISERVGAIGGQLTFSNKRGEGFTLTALLPWQQADIVSPPAVTSVQ
jgi:signal transduction histidine kinase